MNRVGGRKSSSVWKSPTNGKLAPNDRFSDNPHMSFEPPPIPIPMATLAYAPPPENRRPGIMMAVGVMSIVLASLRLLASLGGGFFNFAMLAMSRMPMPTTIVPPGAPTANPSTATVTVDGIEVDPD